MRLISFAIYLGIGAMLHALFIGPHFDWTSAWTFGWLFGWPIMLFITFWTVLIAIGLGVGLLYACWCWLESIGRWKEKRRKNRS